MVTEGLLDGGGHDRPSPYPDGRFGVKPDNAYRIVACAPRANVPERLRAPADQAAGI